MTQGMRWQGNAVPAGGVCAQAAVQGEGQGLQMLSAAMEGAQRGIAVQAGDECRARLRPVLAGGDFQLHAALQYYQKKAVGVTGRARFVGPQDVQAGMGRVQSGRQRQFLDVAAQHDRVARCGRLPGEMVVNAEALAELVQIGDGQLRRQRR